MLDQASNPFAWENDQIKNFRCKHMPNIEFIKNNSISLKNHHISSAACVPSRATLFTGVNSNKTMVHNTDGVAKTTRELSWLDPNRTPTLGNILVDSGKYDPTSVIYIGKHHLKDTILLDEQNIPIETIDLEGNLNGNLQKYLERNMLEDLGFTWLSGPDPHGVSIKNSGFLVDNGFTKIAIDWLKEREPNPNPFVMTLSLVEPHDLVYFPDVCRFWGKRIPIDKKINLEDIPVSLSDDQDISDLPMAYQNWVNRYDSYFVKQNPKLYRQFYYYLLTIADNNLGTFFDYFKTSCHADNTIIIFTSDHGDLCGTHGNGYQKWYSPFEEITNVFCHFMKFLNKKPCWYGEIDKLTSHIDICPTICAELGIIYDKFDGKNIFDKNKNNNDNAITCYIRDHITMGNNLVKFPFRLFPLFMIDANVERRFVPVDQNSDGTIIWPEYSLSIVWKEMNQILYKLVIYHRPDVCMVDQKFDKDTLTELIDKKLILLYDLTNDRCECQNIIKENLHIAIEISSEFKK
jgi:arylsulfatase A-like enzyme